MTATAKVIEIDFSKFQTLDLDEARRIEGGMDPLTAGLLAGGAVLLVAAGGFALGYYVNKDDCPDENKTDTPPDTADTGDTGR